MGKNKLSYKQRYMKEFNVSSEQYDKLYDVYRLRLRHFEKATGSKPISASASFYFTQKAIKQGKPLTTKKAEILKYSAKNSKSIKKQTKKDVELVQNYILKVFGGLINASSTAKSIYNDSSLSADEKLKKLTEFADKLQQQRQIARNKIRESYDGETPFDEDIGDLGYDMAL